MIKIYIIAALSLMMPLTTMVAAHALPHRHLQPHQHVQRAEGSMPQHGPSLPAHVSEDPFASMHFE